jgi:hypothetical protein
MANKTTEENLMDRQDAVSSIPSTIQEALDSVENAESCETPEDFDANVDEAIEQLKEAIAELRTAKRA